MHPHEYVPPPETLAPLEAVTLTAVVGPSGVGKTTLINRALSDNPELHYVLSDVSRPPRPGEQDGIDYHFRTKEEMREVMQRGGYVQVAPPVSGELYANTPESFTGKSGFGIMAVWASAIPRFKQLPFGDFRTVFIVPPDYHTWRQRLPATRDAMTARLQEARASFTFGLEQEDMTYVINDDVDAAARRLATIALASQPLLRQETNHQQARTIIRAILRRME